MRRSGVRKEGGEVVGGFRKGRFVDVKLLTMFPSYY